MIDALSLDRRMEECALLTMPRPRPGGHPHKRVRRPCAYDIRPEIEVLGQAQARARVAGLLLVAQRWKVCR
jgi:hypothetical protein